MKFNISISGLMWSGYIFASLTKNDEAFQELLKKTNNKVELNKHGHIKALEKWLNKWGCRGFSENFHIEISKWYNENQTSLPCFNKTILTLAEKDFEKIYKAYNSLKEIHSVGETSASKILFALRPNSILPWDQPIRKEFYKYCNAIKIDKTYKNFLLRIKENVKELNEECKRYEIKIVDIPQRYGRRKFRYPFLKPIDEYYWITISKNCSLPPKETLKCIFKWS